MWSPGLLLLLLMSAWLFILSSSTDTPSSSDPNGEQPVKTQNIFTNLFSWVRKNPKKTSEILINVVEAIETGKPVSKALKAIMNIMPEGKDDIEAIKSKLKALDIKLDTFDAGMKWDAGAGGAYQTTVLNIGKAWFKYNELKCSSQETGANKKELENMFFTFYNQYADSTSLLYQLLTDEPDSITENLGHLLADKLRCHEKDITTQFLYLNKLICKGNILNDKYYTFKGVNTKARAKIDQQIASQSASALVQSHHRCISDSDTYIERDIFELIDDTKPHKEIAETVLDFLEKTYDRYHWVVFAFTTYYSKHGLPGMRRHIYSGFTEVERGLVTVAVAKQVKGIHYDKAHFVGEAIKKCLSRYDACHDVHKSIELCNDKIMEMSLTQTYTAVHGYLFNSQTATSSVEEPDDEVSEPPEYIPYMDGSPPTVPYILTGECGKGIKRKYIIFIKSDEEMKGVDPCSNVKCENDGKCVAVSGIALCECKYPFYGKKCEESLEKYKEKLLEGGDSKDFCNSLRLDD